MVYYGIADTLPNAYEVSSSTSTVLIIYNPVSELAAQRVRYGGKIQISLKLSRTAIRLNCKVPVGVSKFWFIFVLLAMMCVHETPTPTFALTGARVLRRHAP